MPRHGIGYFYVNNDGEIMKDKVDIVARITVILEGKLDSIDIRVLKKIVRLLEKDKT